MRLRLLTAMGIMALALAVPSAALAHHGRGHHHHHHKARVKARHAKFRLMHIEASAPATTTPTSTTPTTTPPTPENAGTVTSYTGGVLSLTLNDGSTVSGKVTSDTRIRCVKATPTTPVAGPPVDESPGDDNGPGDDQSHGDTSQGDHGEGGWQHGDHGDDGDDDEEVPGATEPPCDSSALVAGAIVRAAELRIGPGGTEFESVLLVR
jgi:hypothetical protein